MEPHFDFEKPIVLLERKLQDLRDLAKQEGVNFSQEISNLEKKVSHLIDGIYSRLTPWQRVQLSRHPNRPYAGDYIEALFPTFKELHGDRLYGDDPAILGGIALWPPAPDVGQIPIMIIGNQKGRTTKQKVDRNFGMARPEGYRKAIRLLKLAERTQMPILTFIDTPGAYPGPDAEERGQSQAIAESIQIMMGLQTPILAIVIGEGGSGGALALGIADQVLMQEYSTYSVISPESCASILWNDASLAESASEKLKMNPNDLLKLKVIDGIIPEPKGGAHHHWEAAIDLLRKSLIDKFNPLLKKNQKKLLSDRILKFRNMGNSALAHAPNHSQGAHE